MDENKEGLKEAETKVEATGDDQPEKELNEDAQVDEPNIETLKERLQKAEEERDNLSKAVVRLNKERKLPSDEEEPKKEEDYPDWDESSKKFQDQTLSKAKSIAEQEARKIIEKSNEKAAIDKFTRDNPNVNWDEVVANYSPKHGKDTVGGITKDLKRALVLTQYEKGEIDSLTEKAFKAGKRKGEIDSQLADISTVSRTTAKSLKKDGGTLSKEAIELAGKLRVDPKKLAEEDDSPYAVIK